LLWLCIITDFKKLPELPSKIVLAAKHVEKH